MKPKRYSNHGSGTLIASFQALLSKAISLEIFQSLRSLLTYSSQVSLGLPLPLPFEIIRQAISWSFIWVSFVEFHTEWIVVSRQLLQDVSTPDDSREKCTTCSNPRVFTETDELDHISLKERYRILLADKSTCPATISSRQSSKTSSKR